MQRNIQENIKSSQTRRELHLGRHVTLEDGILKMAENRASTAARITSDRVCVISGANVQKLSRRRSAGFACQLPRICNQSITLHV